MGKYIAVKIEFLSDENLLRRVVIVHVARMGKVDKYAIGEGATAGCGDEY
jgi:hypothetical protein